MLQVGAVNEFWDALKSWRSRVEVASRKGRPGDILVLANEMPTRILACEALHTATRALLRLQRPKYALEILDDAIAIEPNNLSCQQDRGVALGRAGRFEEARELLQLLAAGNPDGEAGPVR